MDNETFVIRWVTVTLSFVVSGSILALLLGLYNPLVDNVEVFKILAPTLHMTLGAFVGVISTLSVQKALRKNRDSAISANPKDTP